MNKKDCQIICSSQIVQHMVKFNKQNLPTIFAAVETVGLHKVILGIFKQYQFILHYKLNFLFLLNWKTNINMNYQIIKMQLIALQRAAIT